MRLILAGGGNADDSRPLDEVFASWIGLQGRLLYLPVALNDDQRVYKAALQWLTSVFHPLGVTQIEMWTELHRHSAAEFARFAAVYIGGGNTFKLLHVLRTAHLDSGLAEFVQQGGAVYGGSAGAIVLGRDILTSAHFDANEVGVQDTQGLDLVNGYAVWCHYQPEHDQYIQHYVEQREVPVLALPERAGVVKTDGQLVVQGFEPVIEFTMGQRRSIPSGSRIDKA